MGTAALRPWFCLLLLSALIVQPWGDKTQGIHQAVDEVRRDVGHELASSEDHRASEGETQVFAEGEGEKEGEEEKAEKEGYTMGLAMIGGILLIMGLFYLVHHNDMDIRRTSWLVISNTISIFCAVMIFSWSNEFFEALIFDQIENFDAKRWANKFWSLVFYLIFIISLSAKAGIFNPHSFRQATLKTEFVYSVTKNAMGTSIIWAHVVGFAMTYGWGMTQTSKKRPYRKSPLQSAEILPPMIGLTFVYLWGSYLFRSLYKVVFIEAWKVGDRVCLHDLQAPQEYHHHNGKCGTLERFENGKWEVRLDGVTDPIKVRYANLGVEAEARKPISSGDEDHTHTKHFKEFAHEIVGGFYVDEERGATIDIPKGKRVSVIGTIAHDQFSFFKCRGCCLPKWAKVQYNDETGIVPYDDLKTNLQPASQVRRSSSLLLREVSSPSPLVGDRVKSNPNALQAGLLEDEPHHHHSGKEHDKLVDLWEDKIEEGENDIMAINIAFAVIQCLRYAIGGCLPNSHGKELRAHGREEREMCGEPSAEHLCACHAHNGEGSYFLHTPSQVFWLYFWAVLMLSSVFIEDLCESIKKMRCYKTRADKMRKHLEGLQPKYPIFVWAVRATRKIAWRFVDIFQNAGIMGCSWGIIYATEWWLARQDTWTLKDRSIISVYLAIFVSLGCMPFIWAMDKLADFDCLGQFSDKLRIIQGGTGFLIGFTWESVFDDSVDSIGEVIIEDETTLKGLGRPILKCILGLICLGLIVPAWCFYIIPMVEEGGYKMGFIARNLHNRIQRSLQEYVKSEDNEGMKKHRKHQLNHLKYYAKNLKLIEESINFHIGTAFIDNNLGDFNEEELLAESEDSSESSSEEEEELDFPENDCVKRLAESRGRRD